MVTERLMFDQNDAKTSLLIRSMFYMSLEHFRSYRPSTKQFLLWHNTKRVECKEAKNDYANCQEK